MRHRGKIQLAGVAVCVALCAAARLAAQEAAAPAKEQVPAAEATPSRRIEESLPSLYYLKDEQGKLQAMPNFTLKDFEDLFKLRTN